MPIHLPTFPDEEYDTVPVGPNTNECLVLKAIRADIDCTHTDLNHTLSLDVQAVSGAIYRLQEKGLLTYDGEMYSLADSTVAALADSLVPATAIGELDGSYVVEAPEVPETV